MNKIIKTHYPVADLPEDLRQGLDPGKLATITVSIEGNQPATLTLDEIFGSRRPPFRTGEEIDESIRRQRDEWNY